MILSTEQKITKSAIQSIFNNAKFGVVGHGIVAFLIVLSFYEYVPLELLLCEVAIHIFVLFKRVRLIVKYNKEQDTFTNFSQIQKYLEIYRGYMLLSGLAFGSFIFFIEYLSIEYNFFIVAVLVGVSSGAIYTIGEIFILYMTYLVSTIGTALIWVIIQNAETYSMIIIMLLAYIYYSASIAYRFSKNFREILLEKIKTDEHLQEQKTSNNKIIEQKDALDYKANHDDLTDLPNRNLLNDRLNHGMEKAKRDSELLAVCFIDLDNFKIINDSLGHDIGDKVLKKVTKRLQQTIRSHDTLARWGGDEFIVIMEGLKDSEDASILAQKILEVLTLPCELEGQELYVTSSIGISIYPKDSTNLDSLIKYADSAMYKAKDEGKNNFQYYSQDMTKKVFERVVMESSMRVAIKNKEFAVYYQPQVDARNNKLTGMEALVRWNHPVLGLIPPYEFLPLAEENGLIIEIDKLVMDMAMSQYSQWRKEKFNKCVLSLNVAVKYLEQDEYIPNLKENIKKYSIDVRYLVLELTESDVMKNPENTIKKLHELSALGVNIAIDDFGTGYSSLSYLKRLPIDELKIDKSFIDDIPDSEGGVAIVKAIIAMANTIDLTIVAEGVENKLQKDYLVKNGCNIIQGYYYSKPIPENEMLEFMKGMNND